jgi:hypothetical protein
MWTISSVFTSIFNSQLPQINLNKNQTSKKNAKVKLCFIRAL